MPRNQQSSFWVWWAMRSMDSRNSSTFWHGHADAAVLKHKQLLRRYEGMPSCEEGSQAKKARGSDPSSGKVRKSLGPDGSVLSWLVDVLAGHSGAFKPALESGALSAVVCDLLSFPAAELQAFWNGTQPSSTRFPAPCLGFTVVTTAWLLRCMH